MKVYLVEVDNDEPYGDNHHWIEKVFSTYRDASQYLINQGYDPSYEMWFGKSDLRFHWEESDEYMANTRTGKIIEMEVEECL